MTTTPGGAHQGPTQPGPTRQGLIQQGPARHDPTRRDFASDNHAGVLPEAMAAISEANRGHLTSYGEDPYTAALGELARTMFGERATIHPVFNGTGANVVALAAACERWEAAICAATAHVNVDECGAPEKLAGIKLLPVDTPDGKLTPELVDSRAHGFGFVHHAQPRVVTLSQATEMGTVYTVEELRALTDQAHRLGMVVHMDGARLANAAVHLGAEPGDLTAAAGIDVVSLGGTKSGLLAAEAVVVLNPDAVRGVDYVRKLMGQLSSKMRFISAQLLTLYGTDLWARTAAHANAMATRLAEGVRDLPGVQITQPVQTDAVFVTLPPPVIQQLRREYFFHDWDPARHEVRWMCSFDTDSADVDAFLAALTRAIESPG